MKKIVLFTMDGCPHCKHLKEILEKKQLEFIEKNINENDDEYQKLIVEQTNNEYLPAFLFIELEDKKGTGGYNPVLKTITPDDDFDSIEEAADLAENFLK